MSRRETTSAIEACGVVAVIRLQDATRLRAVVDALAEGGVRALEVTMTVPGAVGLIERIASALPDGFLVGAGTVLDAETARAVILAGARFVVGPVFRPDVVTLCHRYDVPVMPGCFTPTEILSAWEQGADLVKVFPATVLGPGYFKDLRGPLPQVRMVPTGGVTLENAADWIRAGAAAVGAGTAMISADRVAAGDYGAIARRAAAFVDAVRQARAGTSRNGVAAAPQNLEMRDAQGRDVR